ncbi:bacteriocin immunity protein [Vibrio quintilis]|uniref:Colicin-E8 immunity protein n=1 Tax=Vibrio quintilis TaxID=1117707 RepID=A0A1M7YPD8_9VIBR|nr:bacteriocin immunity protein [Vibrio quintilis]SHO54491.1 Colicin-E8 immunity protein [Vibrio quintilis]
MDLKATISEYSESDFCHLLNEIIEAQGSDAYQDELLENFISVTEHPDGSDLIYYPDNPADATPERIVEIVKAWRNSQGLPGFKE